jgi:hypothetical protein
VAVLAVDCVLDDLAEGAALDDGPDLRDAHGQRITTR